MKAIFGAGLLLLFTSPVGYAATAADLRSDITLFLETALQANGYAVGEVDGVCDQVLATTIDAFISEYNDDQTSRSGCDRFVAAYHYATKIAGPDIAPGLGLRVITPADHEQIRKACDLTHNILGQFEGQLVIGTAATIRTTKGILIEDIQKGDWDFQGGDEQWREHLKATLEPDLNCVERNLIKIWKESKGE